MNTSLETQTWDVVEFYHGTLSCKILASFETEAQAVEYYQSIAENYEPTSSHFARVVSPHTDA